ncbi:S9 family peptidase [Sandarakinorhabdus sp. DWP1-3-1]|uniref:S9 family peptidase n=1 Tax=Sandarakinorhabdus sp. DWP1-3-1 TaxID=2804627 RepID=UPI003CED5F2F
MMARTTIAAATLVAAAAVAAGAAVPSPRRPVTDPKSLVSSANAAAAPIPLADLVLTRSIGSATWSADGKRLFLVTNFTGRQNIWRVDAGGSWPVQMTQSDESQGDLAASADGKLLYFGQDKGGDELHDIYAVPTGGGAVVNVTNTPDSDEQGLLAGAGGLAFGAKRKTEGQVNLAIIDKATGKVRLLTDEKDPQWRWGPVEWVDGGRALIANRVFTSGSEAQVWRVSVADGAATLLSAVKGKSITASGASADGRTIAATSNAETGQARAGLFDVASGKWRWLATTPWEQEAVALSPDGRRMLVRDNVDGRSSLALVDVATLAVTPVGLPEGLNATAAVQPFTPDSKALLVLHAGADTPSELLVADLAAGRARPLTQMAMASLDPANLAKSQVVTYKSFDGTLISAVVTMPFNLKRDGSNPAIVVPHGGPTGQTQDSFNRTSAALASRGYVVIAPNFRGSTGYGEAFQAANFKDLGGGDLKDTLAAKDFLVASGYVDAARVGITGGSYGGFMTLMAIGKAPDAFAAAVQLFGIINWRTMYRDQDAALQAYQRSLLGRPDEFKGVYEAASPMTFIRATKAPLLTLQGENDIRVPRGQAQEVADVLKAKGNVVETVFYPAEGHGFRKRENQSDSLQRTIDWFDKYLKAAK